MIDLIVLPIVVPLCVAMAALVAGHIRAGAARLLARITVGALLGLSVVLLQAVVDDDILVYRLGDWPAPYGIVLVLDRLAALMLLVTAGLALPALFAANAAEAQASHHFHAIFLLQIAGLNGAFLSGDLFNLFVFFEILLLASYVLLTHGGGQARLRAGLAYVIINIAGSTLFLFALGLLYGTLGTLNLADMAIVAAQVPTTDQALVRTAWILLVLVFTLKAALLPLGFWLPRTYAAARAPVAALFVIMTKVGVYAVLRVSSVALAAMDYTSTLLHDWLTPLALLTIVLGTLGALAAVTLRGVVANIVLVSSGTLLVAVAQDSVAASAAAIFYLVHSVLVTAGLFLLGERIAAGRGDIGDELRKGPLLAHAGRLGVAYLILAIALTGMPPLSGFLGKLMLLGAFRMHTYGGLVWAVLLLSGFVLALVLARAASVLFWEAGRSPKDPAWGHSLRPRTSALPIILLVGASPLLTLWAQPIADFSAATATQIHARTPYIDAVLGRSPQIMRDTRP